MRTRVRVSEKGSVSTRGKSRKTDLSDWMREQGQTSPPSPASSGRLPGMLHLVPRPPDLTVVAEFHSVHQTTRALPCLDLVGGRRGGDSILPLMFAAIPSG
jgi:hypothetical protein